MTAWTLAPEGPHAFNVNSVLNNAVIGRAFFYLLIANQASHLQFSVVIAVHDGPVRHEATSCHTTKDLSWVAIMSMSGKTPIALALTTTD
jgi:hypothetical protein